MMTVASPSPSRQGGSPTRQGQPLMATSRPTSRQSDRSGTPLPSASNSNPLGLSSSFVSPAGLGRNAPARVRANIPRPSSQMSQRRPVTAEDVLSGRRPQSAAADFGESLPSFADMSYDDDAFQATQAEARPFGTPSALRRAANLAATTHTHPSNPNHSTSTAIGRPIHVPYRPDLRAKLSASMTVHTHCQPRAMSLRDYLLLADACQRAGKARMEGHAYYKAGELLAQKRETLEQSISYFEKYLNISRRLNDLQGEAKALNCLGIIYQEMGGDRDLQVSLEYHQQHSDIADAAGVFIANTNMGLITGALGELQRSVEHHKQALQFAVRAQDKQAEALALANLSLVGRSQGDHSTAKVCIERNLQLATTLRDEEASCDAYEQLGMLSTDQSQWNVASDFLMQAMDLSSRQGNRPKTNAIRCKLGFINGTMRMEDHFRMIAKTMGARQQKR
eukprot:TRINITY_DN6162_c1_g1_i1.p1 TRINITY_DN6162_c1_g1~~TRINITY_DN6162_c1_g1_i1.p1  ORF type:complete len:450 (+),score=114.07 TRINITY_DN6162_c1_g1_i1:64-1413(+)